MDGHLWRSKESKLSVLTSKVFEPLITTGADYFTQMTVVFYGMSTSVRFNHERVYSVTKDGCPKEEAKNL